MYEDKMKKLIPNTNKPESGKFHGINSLLTDTIWWYAGKEIAESTTLYFWANKITDEEEIHTNRIEKSLKCLKPRNSDK